MNWRVRSTLLAVELMAVVVMCMSCRSPIGYELSVKNSGDTLISDVKATFGKSRFLVGLLAPGSVKSFHDVGKRVPNVVVLEWRNSDGTINSVKIDIAQKAGPSFSGEVVLEITDENEVEVRLQTEE